MDLTGEHRISAFRDTVWSAMKGDAVLRECIPGCPELAKQSDAAFSAVVVQKIGPMKAKFAGDAELSNINAPECYTIRGKSSGGVAGFTKGGADVVLAADGEETVLRHEVHATLGGILARLGSRLTDSTARKLAARFFDHFQAHLNEAQPEAAE